LSLTTLLIPSSVVRIGDGAFHSCSALASIQLFESLKDWPSRFCLLFVSDESDGSIKRCEDWSGRLPRLFSSCEGPAVGGSEGDWT
jgi:hypothetical protein